MPPELSGYQVTIEIPIQWGDQDLYGHVNNTVYFRWFESARVAYGDRLGFAQLMAERRQSPILAAVSCNYRRQLHYPDSVLIGARILRIGRSSLSMEHKVYSRKLQAVAAEGDSTIVMYDFSNQQPIPVPPDLRAAIEVLEGRPLGAHSPPTP